MTSEYRIDLEPEPDPADVSALCDRLREYNSEAVGASGHQRVTLFVRGEDGAIAGGLLGGTYWGWLHLDVLWVRPDLRQLGFGSQLLEKAEAEALARGVDKAYLETFSFQALEFYQKHGYTVFGELKGIPEGHSQYYLSKVLRATSGR